MAKRTKEYKTNPVTVIVQTNEEFITNIFEAKEKLAKELSMDGASITYRHLFNHTLKLYIAK